MQFSLVRYAPAALLPVACLLVLVASTWLPAPIQAETTNYSGATQITALPYTIETPGTYYIAQNFTVNMSNNWCLGIACSGVTIDLDGHTISNSNGAGTTAYGIYGANCGNVTIRNGTISGFYYGVFLASGAYDSSCTSIGHLVENVNFVKNTFCAANLQGIGCRYYHCRAVLTGGSSAGAFNFALDGAGNSVEDCDVSGETGSATSYGISVSNGTDNFVVNNRISKVAYGVYLIGGGFKYRDNLTSSVTTPYAGGSNAGNNN